MLTDPQVKNAKGRDAPYKMGDALGMYLLVKPDGGKYWRLKYRYAGKEKVLALGVYDNVTLAGARKKRDEARALLAKGLDPGAERKNQKLLRRYNAANTFEAVAREWYESQTGKWSKAHADAVLAHLERRLFPKIGSEPVGEVNAPKLLAVLRSIEATGALEMASKARTVAGQVLGYAVRSGRAMGNPARELRGALATREARHYARLREDDLPTFLGKLDVYDSGDPGAGHGGAKPTRLALTLLTLTFVRPGELRGARWSEFDVDKRLWRIPAERMKAGREHIVPLSRQALAVLEQVREITGSGALLFPSERNARQPMSENTVLFALYRMGYRGRATGHGFRHTASTILNEQQWNPDWIERQLAHVPKDKIRGTYNAAEYLPGRTKMMQAWADFLDAKRAEGNKAEGSKVVSIKRKRA